METQELQKIAFEKCDYECQFMTQDYRDYEDIEVFSKNEVEFSLLKRLLCSCNKKEIREYFKNGAEFFVIVETHNDGRGFLLDSKNEELSFGF